jgi:adenylate cyclase class IV
VADADNLTTVFERMGFTERWRFEKQREDYVLGDAKVFIDESIVGVFVEIEATPDVIASTAAALGKTPADYVLASYRTLAMNRRRSSDKATLR